MMAIVQIPICNSPNLPLIVIYLAADVGSIGGGWFASHLISLGWTVDRARKTTMLLCALAVTPMLFAAKVSDVFPRRAVGGGLGRRSGRHGRLDRRDAHRSCCRRNPPKDRQLSPDFPCCRLVLLARTRDHPSPVSKTGTGEILANRFFKIQSPLTTAQWRERNQGADGASPSR